MKGLRKLYLGIGSIAMLVSSTIVTSCSDDNNIGEYENVKRSSTICFGVKNDAEGAVSRAGVKQPVYAGHYVLRNAESKDTLCVSASVTSGIDETAPGNWVMSRGTAISDANGVVDNIGVYAYITGLNSTGQETTATFFKEAINDDDTDGTWVTAKDYYWPGSTSTTIQFYSYYPYGCEGLTVNEVGSAPEFAYTVPADVLKQQDLMVSYNVCAGNYNASVPLSFSHLCTAIRFKIGDEIATGTIKSISLSGVYGSGEYSYSTGKWSLTGNADVEYTQEIGMSTTSGTTASGTAITEDTQTFLLLPQTLSSATKLTVIFNDDVAGERVLSASLDGGEWKMGTTVTYTISNTPSYDLKFVTEQNAIPVRDCHYEVQEITIGTDGDYTGSWKLSTDASWATLRLRPEEVTERDPDLYHQGYWVVDDKGAQVLAGTSISTGGIKVLVYLYENIEDADREVNISLSATQDGEDVVVDSRTIKQYAPLWNGGKAYERIEEENGPFPWGFNWSSTSATFTGSTSYVRGIIFKVLQFFGYADNVNMSWNGSSATINMSTIEKLGETASDTSNGLQNTIDLWSFEGVQDLANSISLLEAWGMSYSGGVDEQPTDFAVRMVMYKNKFNKETQSSATGTTTIAKLTSDGVQWYLPASGEIGSLVSTACDTDESNNDVALSGEYWTSTAVANSDTESYYYLAADESTDKTASRALKKKIRAARQK